MPLIKYYSFNTSRGTCYDGACEFAYPPDAKGERFYPDEYLIAHILNKYLSTQSHQIDASYKNIIVLTEKWLKNGGAREGGRNTTSINDQIIEAINKHEKTKNTLILVPFLYGYHHPGIAIDVKNKLVIYLDPKTWPPYSEVVAFQKMVISLPEGPNGEKWRFELVKTKQQADVDGTSCGPILTASMIKFVEEFIRDGRITTEGFEAPRRNLATDRLFQMYINNSMEFKDETAIDEVMLADESLWQAVISEQQLNGDVSKEICREVSKQKTYIKSLEVKSLETPDSLALKKVQLIRDFQSRLTEVIFLSPDVMQVNVAELLALNNRILSATNEENLSAVSSFITKPAILLEAQYLNRVHEILRLTKSEKQNSIQTQSNTVSTSKNNSCATWLKILLAVGMVGGGVYLLSVGTIASIISGAICTIGGIGLFVHSKYKQESNISSSSQQRLISSVP